MLVVKLSTFSAMVGRAASTAPRAASIEGTTTPGA